jgi:superfamily II DNA or RNA helicase
MAGHWNKNYSASVQVCSIDTLYARKDTPPAKIIVVDEVHQATSDGYKWLAQQYPDAYFLGVTATPFVKKDLSHIVKEVVKPITMKQLIAQGYLVRARHFAPQLPELSGIKKQNGDYSNDELFEKTGAQIVGDMVNHWNKYGEARPTLAFGINIAHSKMIVDSFKQAGIPARHVDADCNDRERNEAIQELKSGKIKVLSNVGILCTGVDIPFLGCIIMARPTMSYNLYIQQAGRGTRIADGKSDFIILDHAGNGRKHGPIDEEKELELDGRDKKTNKGKICSDCYLVYVGTNCPICGPKEKIDGGSLRVIEHVEGELKELEADPVLQCITELKRIQKARGYKRGWVYFQLKEKFGEEIANKYIPKRIVPHWISRG